jgi:hypothetical protein
MLDAVMRPDPTDPRPPPSERGFYIVMWSVVALLILVPLALALSGEGSTLGAFVAAPLALLVVMRLARPKSNNPPPPPSN